MFRRDRLCKGDLAGTLVDTPTSDGVKSSYIGNLARGGTRRLSRAARGCGPVPGRAGLR
jgi:hypothetical protein